MGSGFIDISGKICWQMSHNKNEVWLHIVFSTKNRENLIPAALEKELYQYLEHQFASQKCKVEEINGTGNHIHILIKSNLRIGTSEIVGKVKGSSSYWLNRHPKMEWRFDWQRGYSAFSVQKEQLYKVINYIRQQKIIHAIRSKNKLS